MESSKLILLLNKELVEDLEKMLNHQDQDSKVNNFQKLLTIKKLNMKNLKPCWIKAMNQFKSKSKMDNFQQDPLVQKAMKT
jgi:hypothetical protein